MSPGRLLRFFFLPELSLGLAGARGSLRRTLRFLAAACPPAGKVKTASLLLPAARPAVVLGLALVLGGSWLTISAVAGLGEAAAQSIDRGLFAAEDVETRKILEFLSGFGQDGTTVLGQMLEVFNYGVLALVGYLLIWHTVTGSVDTAREGRWGFGAWEAIRMLVAVALMWPLPGGMSAAQHVVVGFAKLGGDFANAVWKPVAVETLGKGRTVIPWPREREWRMLIGQTLVAEVCRHVANEEARLAGDDPYVALRRTEERPKSAAYPRARRAQRAARPVARTIHYDGSGNGMPRDLCGAIRFEGLDEKGSRGIAARGHLSAWERTYEQIRQVATTVGDHFVEGSASFKKPLPDVPGLLDRVGAAGTYRAILEVRMKEAGDAGQQELEAAIGEDAQKLGWLGAAGFVTSLARAAGRIQAAAQNVPRASLPSPELEQWSANGFAAVQATVRAVAQEGGYQPVQLALATGIAGARAPSEGRGGTFLKKLTEWFDLDDMMVAESGNPLLDLTSMGFFLINSALGAITTIAGVSVGSNLFELFPGFGKGLDAFEAGWQVMDGIVTPIIGAVLIGGVLLAYLLPAIPFIRFLFGILGWLLAVVEAVLAVTVFCAAHVMRGEGNRLMIEGTRQGWLLLPALILRPVLMLFGLVLGYFLFLAAMGLFNDVWVPLLEDVNTSSGLDLIDFLGLLALYLIVAYGIVNACFKAIDVLPNAVIEWIGGQARGDAGAEAVGSSAVGGFGRAGMLRGFGPLGRGGGTRLGGGQ